MWLQWSLYLLLAIVLIGSLYLTLLTAPGLWVMAIATIVYAICTGGAYAGMKTVVAVLILAGVAELLEFLVIGTGAKRAGASRRGLWGAVIGSVIGGLFFTAIVPVPIIGTIFGVCLGTFVGALVGELWGGTEVVNSVRVGVGAAIGRLIGIFTKLIFGIAILATALIAAMPPIFHRHVRTPVTTPVAPTSQHASLTLSHSRA